MATTGSHPRGRLAVAGNSVALRVGATSTGMRSSPTDFQIIGQRLAAQQQGRMPDKCLRIASRGHSLCTRRAV